MQAQLCTALHQYILRTRIEMATIAVLSVWSRPGMPCPLRLALPKYNSNMCACGITALEKGCHPHKWQCIISKVDKLHQREQQHQGEKNAHPHQCIVCIRTWYERTGFDRCMGYGVAQRATGIDKAARLFAIETLCLMDGMENTRAVCQLPF